MTDNHWELKLNERTEQGNLRSLKTTEGMLDFVSNDYLGLARNHTLYELIKLRMDEVSIPNKNGSGGSRLLSGNSEIYEQLETMLAKVFRAESCLIFNSGYQANLALLASVPQQGDTILYDQLSHICLKEGAWLSKAESVMFAHNDLEDLERKLKLANGTKYIILESVYSMDGDYSPLQAMMDLAEKYDAKVIIDEAHSTGVLGPEGAGWCVQEGLQDRVFARVYTFGKAMGVHGACIAGSETLKNFLINFARPFIYTTAMPVHSIVSIEQSFLYLSRNMHLQEALNQRITFFREGLGPLLETGRNCEYPGSTTAIQPLIVPGNDFIKDVAFRLQEECLDVRPILAPTVKKGAERLRISLHVHNTEKEIQVLLQAMNNIL